MIENTDNAPVNKFSLNRSIVPINPINKLNINACPVFILPEGGGLSAVLDMSLSKSRSIISLNPLAEPVTKKPLIVRIAQLNQLISPCTLLPNKKAMEAENTTVKVNRSLTSFLKSFIKSFTFYPNAQYTGLF